MTVADRIKNRRLELHLSQEELAKKAGYTDKTSISKLENAGDTVSMKQINRLAPALECTSAYLMGWEGIGSILYNYLSDNTDPTPEEKEMIKRFRRITPQTQKIVTNIIDTEYAEIIEKEKNQNSAS